MALKLVYLAASRLFAWTRLAARDSTAKDVEILILRHQLAVAQRRDPRLALKLTWADRAWLALLAGWFPGTGSAASAGSSRPRLLRSFRADSTVSTSPIIDQLDGSPNLSKNARFRSVAALTRRSKLTTSMYALYGSL